MIEYWEIPSHFDLQIKKSKIGNKFLSKWDTIDSAQNRSLFASFAASNSFYLSHSLTLFLFYTFFIFFPSIHLADFSHIASLFFRHKTYADVKMSSRMWDFQKMTMSYMTTKNLQPKKKS